MTDPEALAPSRDYLKTYSLSTDPFSDKPDGRFFYAGAALMQRLDLLTHLAQFGDAVILVSGPPGSGKTTLLSRFVTQSGKQWRLCPINAGEFDQFAQRLGDALGIGDPGDERQLLEQWAGQHEASQLLVISIDDAQHLQAEAVQVLCALLALPQGDRVRLILFGTPEAQLSLKQTLESQPQPLTAQLLELPKLSEEETAAYLMYRLAVAGYSGESPFNATEVRAICKAADGRPGTINQLAHAALQEHQMRAHGKRRPALHKSRTTQTLVWALATLLLIGLVAFIGWQRQAPSETARRQAPETTAKTKSAVPQPAVTPTDAPHAAPLAPSSEPETNSGVPALEAVSPPPPAALREPRVITGTPLPATENIAQEAPQPGAEAPRDAGSASPAPTLEPAAPALPATVLPSAPTVVTPSLTTAMHAEPESDASSPAATVAPQPAPAAANAIDEPPTRAESAPAPGEVATSPAPEAVPHREAWLLQQPADYYSLQLLGSRQKAPLLKYIERNQLDPGRCAYYQGNFQGKAWYVLVYGLFADRQAALTARRELPARVQKEKPWPRSLASIQSAVRAAQ